MNDQLQEYARTMLKEGLAKLPEANHRTFKLMYARDGGKRSVDDAVAMQINDVVDCMPSDRLDWAMQQVQTTLNKMHNERANPAAKPWTILRECQECGESMPAERQAHGFRLCFYCQSLREARQLRYGGRNANCD